MSLSMYQASVPVFIRMLGNLSAILDKAAAYAEAKKIDPTVLIRDRLAPDMLPLSFQIQTTTDHAKGCTARLAGIEAPKFADTESTFPELKERIAKTVSFLQSVTAAQVDGSEDRAITLSMRSGELKLQGQNYLLSFALPNFYFHITTAYAILRHNGVELGKGDYIGGR
ncbi:DUF1993 domain-containing protein [Hyalangium versicolor]|uniref:DUF1993 domain-containing protein n=1 Tax=Hyalangium versicolor TaxID=2861190 RepID=UPI001CCE4518|nr:DUF1993 domain-containing protein [Hyalangium versicolor]